ncbi:MAG TPA: DUF433 domain-containing protein [Lacipirellulaceae bacterium]|nr:DUF433 domain-containing protein [Lacipirellulaceae bacterium]
MSTISPSHIHMDERHVAWIDDTNIKVIEVALEHIAHGSSSDEIFEQHNGYLTMAQIHAALMHYYDHQAEYDAEIDRQLREYDRLHSRDHDSPGRRRLRELGKLS